MTYLPQRLFLDLLLLQYVYPPLNIKGTQQFSVSTISQVVLEASVDEEQKTVTQLRFKKAPPSPSLPGLWVHTSKDPSHASTYITGSTLKSQLQLPVPQYIYGDASAHCWAQRERTHADTLTNTHTNYLHKTTRRERMRRIESLIAIIIITHSMSTKAAITIISCLMQILVRTSLQTILQGIKFPD